MFLDLAPFAVGDPPPTRCRLTTRNIHLVPTNLLSELAGMSARSVAAELNARRVKTPSGALWSAKTVIRARERLARLTSKPRDRLERSAINEARQAGALERARAIAPIGGTRRDVRRRAVAGRRA